MIPVILSQTGAGSSRAYQPDLWIAPFNVGFGVVVSAGASLTFTVEYTFDDIQNPSVTPTWFPHPTAAGSANLSGNFAFPVNGIRLTVANGGTGAATLTILQAGSVGA
jgi:hypothetical protein